MEHAELDVRTVKFNHYLPRWLQLAASPSWSRTDRTAIGQLLHFDSKADNSNLLYAALIRSLWAKSIVEQSLFSSTTQICWGNVDKRMLWALSECRNCPSFQYVGPCSWITLRGSIDIPDVNSIDVSCIQSVPSFSIIFELINHLMTPLNCPHLEIRTSLDSAVIFLSVSVLTSVYDSLRRGCQYTCRTAALVNLVAWWSQLEGYLEFHMALFSWSTTCCWHFSSRGLTCPYHIHRFSSYLWICLRLGLVRSMFFTLMFVGPVAGVREWNHCGSSSFSADCSCFFSLQIVYSSRV